MANEKVLNKYRDDVTEAIDIMRGTSYGNPFILYPRANDEARNEVCDQHFAWAIAEIISGHLDIEPLRNNNMFCVCAPKRCHGDNYVKILSWCMKIHEDGITYCMVAYGHDSKEHAGGICLTHGSTLMTHSSDEACEPEMIWAA